MTKIKFELEKITVYAIGTSAHYEVLTTYRGSSFIGTSGISFKRAIKNLISCIQTWEEENK